MNEAKNIKNKTKKTAITKTTTSVKKAVPAKAVSALKTTVVPKASANVKLVKSVIPAPSRIITTEIIAARAYTLWEQAGRPNGRDVEYWLQAESQLKQEQSFAA